RARVLLYDASGQHPHLSAQPGTPGQSCGSGRPFLALRRSGLSFRFSALLSSLTINNPPDISPVEHETEEYAHEVRRHVRGYLMVGATLLAFTAITVALSYVNFGTQKANVAVALLVATFKAGLVAAIFMHLSAEKRLIYRILIFTGFFVFGLFWLTYLAWYNPIVRYCLSQVFTLFLSSSRPCWNSLSAAIAFGSVCP